ncbi:hypothetical protein C789_2754 [Microcystis aeruginosa FACHB-905 = DIANCHI905]|nr:hypothetical protein C789_2754 [Microcystis aeruginosa FACHB-905 = DIANCHI905]
MSFVSLWFVPLPRWQDLILEYILPTKPKRARYLLNEPFLTDSDLSLLNRI